MKDEKNGQHSHFYRIKILWKYLSKFKAQTPLLPKFCRSVVLETLRIILDILL